MTKPTIYDFPIGPYPSRVRIALYEKGMFDDIQFELIKLYKGEHKTEYFKSNLNYTTKVPVLKLVDGRILAECSALTQYFDNLDHNPILTGRSPFEIAEILMWTRRVEIELLEPMSVYWHHGTAGLGPTVELYQNNEWGNFQLEKSLKGLKYFNSILETRPYIVGDHFTMADIAAIGGFMFYDVAEVKIPQEYTAILEWYERVKQRSSVKEHFKMVEAWTVPESVE